MSRVWQDFSTLLLQSKILVNVVSYNKMYKNAKVYFWIAEKEMHLDEGKYSCEEQVDHLVCMAFVVGVAHKHLQSEEDDPDRAEDWKPKSFSIEIGSLT